MASISLLFVDAYDSFTQNIVALLHHKLNANVTIIQKDTSVAEEFNLRLVDFLQRFDAVVLGPGPGDPRHGALSTGIFQEVIEHAATSQIPLLGICLGFQTICLRYGLNVERMQRPCHGQTKQIFPVNLDPHVRQRDDDIFENLYGGEVWATCYNSLGVSLHDNYSQVMESRPGSSSTTASFSSRLSRDSFEKSNPPYSDTSHDLKVLATDDFGYVMAVVHKDFPVWGLQFHPESCKSNKACSDLLMNWFSRVRKYVSSKSLGMSTRTIRPTARVPNPVSCCNDIQSSSSRSSHRSVRPTPDRASVRPIRRTDTIISQEDIHCYVNEHLSSVSNTVSYRKAHTACTREELSERISGVSSQDRVVMLESTKKGRFSIYAILRGCEKALSAHSGFVITEASDLLISCRQDRLILRSEDGLCTKSHAATTTKRNLMDALERVVVSKRATGGSPELPFWGGFIGHISYESGLDDLNVNLDTQQERSVDDISLVWVERSIVYDSDTSSVYVQSIRRDDDDFLNSAMSFSLQGTALSPLSSSLRLSSKVQSARDRHALRNALNSATIKMPDQAVYNYQYDQCQEELHRGNSYELCLTTEAQVSLSLSSEDSLKYEMELYRNLHKHNPVPFGAYMNLPDHTIISTSPEQYMSWTRDGKIDMIPMKGTVKRSSDVTLADATAILSTPKETGENLMIADLIRHDLYSTVGHTSNVEVIKLCEVVEHETVYQLVSHIRAHAPIDRHSSTLDKQQQQAIHYGFKALAITLPPGSMTGAPKKSSCEILSHIEARDRGIYSGVLGYFDVGGGGCWSVCIRTAFRSKTNDDDDETTQTTSSDKIKHTWRVGAGGAITVLSDRQGEWEEMQVKLKSVLKGFQACP